jgi:hypothetical protein
MDPENYMLNIFRTGNPDLLIDEQYVDNVLYNSILPIKLNQYLYGVKDFKISKSQYSSNSFGYRGPEFGEQVDMICIGDSHTYGSGMPDKMIWTSLLFDMLGQSYVNLARPGGSIQSCVNNALSYIKKYGKPKKILAVFPDLGRINVVLNTKINRAINIEINGPADVQMLSNYSSEDIPKYIKKPFLVEYTNNMETAMMMSLRSILFLEMYCEEAGIELFWTSISKNSHDALLFLSGNSNSYNNFVDLEHDLWGGGIAENQGFEYLCTDSNHKAQATCHMDLLDLYGNIFFAAMDRVSSDGKPMNPHIGLHRHTHIAEKFYSLVKGGS